MSSFVFYGIFYNQSIWYKLTKKTGYAILLTLTGALITIAANVFFVKKYLYMAAAYGHFFAYLAMMIISYFIGRHYYKIDYRIKRILEYIIIALVIFALRYIVSYRENYFADVVSAIMIFVYGIYILQREKLIKIIKNSNGS